MAGGVCRPRTSWPGRSSWGGCGRRRGPTGARARSPPCAARLRGGQTGGERDERRARGRDLCIARRAAHRAAASSAARNACTSQRRTGSRRSPARGRTVPGRARARRRVSAHEYVRATRDPRRAGAPRTWHVNSPTFHNSSKEPVFPPAVRQTPRLPPASGQRGGWGGGRSGARPLVELELGAAAAGALANGLKRLAQVRNAEDIAPHTGNPSWSSFVYSITASGQFFFSCVFLLRTILYPTVPKSVQV